MDGETARIVVMGVSGAGKSTLGAALARALSGRFVDGDDLHPAENRDRMAAGIALTDADRAPWLDRVAAALETGPLPVVVACSALRRVYRDRLRRVAGVRFILPVAPRSLIAARLAARQGHYMPASLLDSQLATFEMPGPEEHAIAVPADLPVEIQVARVLAAL